MNDINHLAANPLPERTKIMVCVNDNDHSRVALHFACRKAKQLGCPVALLHVIEPTDQQSFLAIADKMRREKRDEAEALLQKFAAEAYEGDGVTPVLVVKEGLVGEQIVSAVEEDYSINMLVVGTAPDSPGRGNLLPFLAAQLGKKLQIPMMIIPGNLTEQQIRELT